MCKGMIISNHQSKGDQDMFRHYKGFLLEKPEGSKYWTIWKPAKIRPFGEKVGLGRTLKECRLYIDNQEV